MKMYNYIILLVLMLFAGYGWGHYDGEKDGYVKGRLDEERDWVDSLTSVKIDWNNREIKESK